MSYPHDLRICVRRILWPALIKWQESNMERVHSAVGALVLLAIAFALCPSSLRRNVRWVGIASGLVLLVVFAALSLRPPLNGMFAWASQAINALLAFSNAGAA